MNPFKFFIFAYWHDPRWKKFVGATVKIWDLAHNLAKLGHEVCIFLPKYDYDTSESRIKIVGIRFIDLPFLRLLSYNLYLAFYLIAFCIRTPPDVVYMRRMGSIIPGIYARLVKALFFYEVNDDPYSKSLQEGSLMTFRVRTVICKLQDKINLKLCKRAFVITYEIVRKIKANNPHIEAQRFIELPSGANTDVFKPIPVRECRKRLHVDLRKKYIGFAGTLFKRQGIDILIDAAPSILAHEPLSRFLVVGEGPMKEMWMKAVETKGLGEHFIFSGQVDYEDMPTWIGAMDVCVAPFLKTAGLRSPVKIFDYMACGKPVVASRIDGTTDVFVRSGAIKQVSPESPPVLSDAIVDLLQNEKKAAEMGAKGRAFVLKKYDRKSIAQRVLDEAISCRI